MKLHENYIKALEDNYKDFSYSETIEMIKKNRLYVAANSKYTIQSLPKDRVWAEDINTENFKDADEAMGYIEFLTDKELHNYSSHSGDSEYGMWVSSKKAKLIKDKWEDEQWWEDNHNDSKEINDIEDEFNESKGEEFNGIIYNHSIDFTYLTDNEGAGKLITDSLKDKSEFEEQLRNKEVVIDEHYEDAQYRNASSDIRIYYFDLIFKEKQHLEVITFIKDYEGYGVFSDGTLELEGLFDGYDIMKNTLTRDVKFLNPINGKWENFLLEYDNDSGVSDSINYNYTHHLSDDNFDFSKDFPEEDKLNKALKLHLEYIKKYGKE